MASDPHADALTDVDDAGADDEATPGADEEAQWDRGSGSDEESLTPESLEDEMEGRALAPEEDALHETSGAELWEAIADEGVELEGMDPDDVEANLAEVREAEEEGSA